MLLIQLKVLEMPYLIQWLLLLPFRFPSSIQSFQVPHIQKVYYRIVSTGRLHKSTRVRVVGFHHHHWKRIREHEFVNFALDRCVFHIKKRLSKNNLWCVFQTFRIYRLYSCLMQISLVVVHMDLIQYLVMCWIIIVQYIL